MQSRELPGSRAACSGCRPERSPSTVRAEVDLDFGGTLGVDRAAPVGFRAIRLAVDLKTDARQDKMDTLLKLIFDCGATSYCDFSQGGCAPRLAAGAPCEKDFAECAGAGVCGDGTTLICVAAGAACMNVSGQVSPCASGHCSNGTCASVLPQVSAGSDAAFDPGVDSGIIGPLEAWPGDDGGGTLPGLVVRVGRRVPKLHLHAKTCGNFEQRRQGWILPLG